MVTKKPPADPTLAKLLRHIRDDAQVSQIAVASRVGCTRPMITLVENGSRRPNDRIIHTYLQLAERGPDMRRRNLLLAAAVAAGITGLPAAFTEPDPLRVAHEWIVGNNPLRTHREAGNRLGSTVITELEQRLADLRLADDTMSGNELLPIVQQDLDTATEAARTCSYSSTVGADIGRIIIELRQLAGWITFNFTDYSGAERRYMEGVTHAREIGDDTRVAWLLSSIAYQKSLVGDLADTNDALLLAKSAITGLTSPTPKVAILLHERLAWAAANLGETDTTLRALDAVAELHQADTDTEPPWVYWLTETESEIMAGRCLAKLGRAHEAIPRLEAAINDYPQDHTRELALYRSYLGEALAHNGETEAAIEQYELSAATDTSTNRVQRRLGELHHLINQ